MSAYQDHDMAEIPDLSSWWSEEELEPCPQCGEWKLTPASLDVDSMEMRVSLTCGVIPQPEARLSVVRRVWGRVGFTRHVNPIRPRGRRVTMPTYRLYLEDGSDAGEYRTAGYGFDIGDVIHLGPDRPGWRILEIAEVPEDAPYAGRFMVEPSS
jgi:hypothetical protein